MVTACDGLDHAACAAVEDVLAERLVGMDPARITTVARKVATRIAADQVAAATAKNKKDRPVQVTPGPDGTTDWWARLPAARSAAAWAAVRDLGDQYATKDPDLTLDQARADALIDLLLTNVTVTANVTLGIPVNKRREEVERRDDREIVGEAVRGGVVGRGEAGDQLVGRRLGAEAGERVGEKVRPELRGAAAAVGQLGQADRREGVERGHRPDHRRSAAIRSRDSRRSQTITRECGSAGAGPGLQNR